MDLLDLRAVLTLDSSKFENGIGKVKSGFATAAKIGIAAVGTATTAVGVLTSKSVSAYGEYEQLLGGVQKLYGNMGMSLEEYAKQQGQSIDEAKEKWSELEEAQTLVQKNAEQAYKTAGMSMNEYMDTATGFSAALINSLGGDTLEAAKQTDIAMRAISDNFNTFGGDINNVRNAYMGFAKQNYTMLDNLKLGYGGTKTEMERLIKDANKYAKSIGQTSNLSIKSFSDIVTAIDLVQQKQQIAGTTAREASTTIQGSLGMVKSAWQNLLTGMANGDADISKLMNNLVGSITGTTNAMGNHINGFLDNIIPVVETAISSISTLIEKAGPKLASRIPAIVAKVLPSLVSAGEQILISLGQGIFDNIDMITGVISDIITELSTALVNGSSSIIKGVSQLISKVLDAVIQNLPQITPLIVDFIVGLTQIFVDNIDKVIDVAITIAGAIGEGLIQAAPIIVDKIPIIIREIVKGFEEHPEALVTIAPFILKTIANGLLNNTDIIKKVMPAIGKAFDKVPILSSAKTALTGFGTAIGNFMTADLGATLAAGGTAAIGTMATAIAGGAAAAFGGLQLGNKIGNWLFPEDAELYEKYSGIAGTFELIKDTAVAVGDGLAMEWEREMKIAKENWDIIGTFVGETWVKIEDGAGKLRDNLQPVFEAAKTNAVNAFNDARSKFDAKMAEIRSVFEPARAWFETTFTNAKNSAVGAFNDAKSKLAAKWNEMKAAIPAVAWFDSEFKKARDKVVGAFSDIGSKFKTIWGNIKDAFNLSDALTWGKDLVKNFIDGIKSKAADLKEELKGVADKVKAFLGFSEPEEGPLSDFHTYAPDMMKLFAKGIHDNAHLVTDQISKSFDFGSMITSESSPYSGGFNAGGITINLYARDGQSAREVVDEVEYRIAKNVEAKKAVWAM